MTSSVVDNLGNFLVDNLSNFIVVPDAAAILARARMTGETPFHVAFNNDFARFAAAASGDSARFLISRIDAVRHLISAPEVARHISAALETARHNIATAEVVVSNSLSSEL